MKGGMRMKIFENLLAMMELNHLGQLQFVKIGWHKYLPPT